MLASILDVSVKKAAKYSLSQINPENSVLPEIIMATLQQTSFRNRH